jgi:hypothetical protein
LQITRHRRHSAEILIQTLREAPGFRIAAKRGIGHAEFWIRQCVVIEHDTNGIVEQLWYRCGGRAG